MPNESTLQAVMKTNNLSREQAMQVFSLTNQKKIDLASAIAEVKGGLPSLPETPIAEESPSLPDEQPGQLLSFANAINQATNLARQKRNKASVELMAPFRGTVAASDFNSILGNLNRASDKRASDLTEQALKLQESSNELLSVSEAKDLGLPFGTTKKEAAGKGIIPKSTTKSEEEKRTEYEDDFSAAEEYVAANQDMDAASLTRELRKGSSKLTDGDISSIVNTRVASDAELASMAKALVSKFIEPTYTSTRTGELDTAKDKAKQLVSSAGGKLAVNGRQVKVDIAKWNSFVDNITSDRATANELLELKELQEAIK